MEDEILKQIVAQSEKIDRIYKSVESTRKYFLWTFIITVACFVLPLIGLVFAIPQLLSIYSSASLGI